MVVLGWFACVAVSAVVWPIWLAWMTRGAISSLSCWNDLADEWQPEEVARLGDSDPVDEDAQASGCVNPVAYLDAAEIDRHVALSA